METSKFGAQNLDYKYKSGIKGNGWDHQGASVERKETRKDMCGVGGVWQAVREGEAAKRCCIILMGDVVLTENVFLKTSRKQAFPFRAIMDAARRASAGSLWERGFLQPGVGMGMTAVQAACTGGRTNAQHSHVIAFVLGPHWTHPSRNTVGC